MINNYINEEEVIDLFIHRVINDIKIESEIPNVNFIFDDLENFESISKRDIDFISKYNKNSYSIKINNTKLFFKLLTELCNAQIDLRRYYGLNVPIKEESNAILRRIWLRATQSDFDNIEVFLQKQIEFIKDRTFDNPNNTIKYNNIYGYDVYYEIKENNSYSESSRRLEFTLDNNNNAIHSLPSILYDIRKEDNEKVCYIYAVQNEKTRKINKKIEKKLYNINKDMINGQGPVHPNFSTSMFLFLNLLKDKGITKVRVPLFQMLSYDYHLLLSDGVMEYFIRKWTPKKLNDMKYYEKNNPTEYERLKKEYDEDKLWLNNLYNKAEFISHNKTDNLYKLVDFMNTLGVCIVDGIDYDDTIYLDIDVIKKVL